MPMRISVAWFALSLAFGSANAALAGQSAPASTRMADGKQWTTQNLNVSTVPSHCYDDSAANCRTYGRLYAWDAAQRGCQSLGDGWRLPTDDEWRRMATHYGGLWGEPNDKATYPALMSGGSSGFNALLGGNRMPDGRYERLDAHGLYWTASESGAATAWMYNFGRGGQALGRHGGQQKQMSVSVRCVRD